MAKVNCVKSCLHLMRILCFGDMKARVGRMENGDVRVGYTVGKRKGFFLRCSQPFGHWPM